MANSGWDKSNISAAIAAVAAILSAGFAALTWWSVPSDQLDFDGLSVRAEIYDAAQPRLILPSTFDREPISVTLKGAVRDVDNPSLRPSNFELTLALQEIERDESGTVLVYEDVRPVLCEEFGGPGSCERLEISSLALLAEFARGPKSANIYDIPTLRLN